MTSVVRMLTMMGIICRSGPNRIPRSWLIIKNWSLLVQVWNTNNTDVHTYSTHVLTWSQIHILSYICPLLLTCLVASLHRQMYFIEHFPIKCLMSLRELHFINTVLRSFLTQVVLFATNVIWGLVLCGSSCRVEVTRDSFEDRRVLSFSVAKITLSEKIWMWCILNDYSESDYLL